MLKIDLINVSFTLKHAGEDASVVIVNTVISLCSPFKADFFIGEDFDLLGLLTGLKPFETRIFGVRACRGKTAVMLNSIYCLNDKESA